MISDELFWLDDHRKTCREADFICRFSNSQFENRSFVVFSPAEILLMPTCSLWILQAVSYCIHTWDQPHITLYQGAGEVRLMSGPTDTFSQLLSVTSGEAQGSSAGHRSQVTGPRVPSWVRQEITKLTIHLSLCVKVTQYMSYFTMKTFDPMRQFPSK